ncbi:MAG TPA: ABC transporter permease [Ignisphaera aggregans]|uniref:ABC transporter permease n=1 Tax=Ignisphaera aggregans TaxID=334771 RepID=A0A832YS55_9CREN|nr:ABC transporter permease [Ignisphaera aggregans]
MRWIVRRAIIAFLTVFTAMTLSFFVIKAMPGDPIDALAQAFVRQYYMSYEEAYRLALAAAPFVPKGPVWKQYVEYMTKFFRGDLGVSISFSTGKKVAEILADAIPWTVLVVATSLVISFLMGIVIGMVMAYKHGSKLDSSLIVAFSILRSIPEYIVAILLLWILAFQMGLFPTGGRYDYWALELLKKGDVLAFLGNVLWHAALPILTWIITHISGWALAMRGSTIGVLGEDFITYAKVRGLPSRRIVIKYVGKNAILPLFTSFMLSLGFMFGGSIFIEFIFSYQGVGWVLYQSITQRDWYLMLGAFNIIIIAVVLGALLADMLYGFLDPRIRRGGTT